MLSKLQSLVNEMNTTTSAKEKMVILKKYDCPEIKQIIMYTYNPYFNYGVSMSNIIKRSDIISRCSITNIIELLDKLRTGEYTGHNAIGAINGFINNNLNHRDLILHILDGDLRIRLGVKNFNKIFPGCVPQFSVALAQKFSEKHFQSMSDDILISRKLDGLRCIVKLEGDTFKFYSRSGKEFKTLDVLNQFMLNNYKDKLQDYVIDGEICIYNNDKEDFKAISSEYNRKNHTIKNPKLVCFDIIPKTEFENTYGSTTYRTRFELLKRIVTDDKFIKVVESWTYTESAYTEALQLSESSGWEGLMLRDGNSPYEGKRTKSLLKVKQMQDAEFMIVDASNSILRWVEEVDGVNKEIEVEGLKNITIDLGDGNLVSCGSGFDKDQRLYYKDKHDKLIGNEATIQFFEKTQDANGKPSLRFPVIKAIHNGIRIT